MARRIDKQGKPERIPDTEIESFLKVGIPYRLTVLAIGERVLRAGVRKNSESALVEATIITGRLLIEFLGLKTKQPKGAGPPELVASGYRLGKNDLGEQVTDDVKITDLGGRLVKREQLDKNDAKTIANLHHGASKTTAHLTHDSGHQVNPETLLDGIPIIRWLVLSHLPERGRELVESALEKAGP